MEHLHAIKTDSNFEVHVFDEEFKQIGLSKLEIYLLNKKIAGAYSLIDCLVILFDIICYNVTIQQYKN